MSEYLEERRQLAGIVQLLDSRHEPSALDGQMVAWLKASGLPFLLVLTKADKIRRGQRAAALSTARRSLELDNNQPLLFFSSETGEGKREAMAWIAEALAAWSPEDD
jgi:GTP-binding protein